MFDIDLLNKTGLQKNISKIKINEKSKKQKIIFEKLTSNDEVHTEAPVASSEHKSPLSFLLVGILFIGLVFIGSFDYNKLINNNVFLSANTEERIFANIIRLLNNSDDAILLESIHLNKSLDFSLRVDDLENIKLINNKAIRYSCRIYEDDKNKFRVLFSYPLNRLNQNQNQNQQLTATIMRYKNDYNVDSQMYGKSILFTSDSKTILKILEGLIYTGIIKIWPDANGRFNLEYTS